MDIKKAIINTKIENGTEKLLLFGFLPVFTRKIKTPVIKENTFLVWEPCSISHSEVVPGFSKYLLDLGYHVSVIVHPDRYKEGLFSRFNEENITYNKMNKKDIQKFFKSDSLKDVKGVMVTTVGKICDCIHYNKAYDAFNPNFEKSKLLFVEHESCFASDKGMWKKDLITLRPLNYNNETSVVVNPHYFGEIKTNKKNETTNFIMIGAIRPNKRNSNMIVEAANKLLNENITNFKITVVGKGTLKHIPKETRKYIDIKGRLPFKKMYDEIEKADFILMPYNENDPEHIRYNTSGTSGNFQLVYGFLKPCVLIKSFAPINGLDETNSILYDKDEDFYKGLKRAIEINNEEYDTIRNNLKALKDRIYLKSKENLSNLIKKGTNYNE